MAFGLPLNFGASSGPRESFGHLEIVIAGIPFVAIKKASYGRTRTREEIRGTHPDPLGKSQGENAYKLEVEVYRREFRIFRAQLRTLGIVAGLGDYQFDTTIATNCPGMPVTLDTAKGCTLDDEQCENAQGPGGLTTTLDLKPLKILFDGADDVARPLGLITVFANASI